MFTLILGPMYSGKSTELLRLANRYKCINKKVMVINHSINNRYDTKDVSTHDKHILEANIVTDKLCEIDYKDVDVIIIEELQFFEDAYEFVTKAMRYKTIIAAGLNGDFNREPFMNIIKLISYAEKIKKLSALCKRCNDGTLANYSKLVNKHKIDNQILVGGVDEYEAVCLKHYDDN